MLRHAHLTVVSCRPLTSNIAGQFVMGVAPDRFRCIPNPFAVFEIHRWDGEGECHAKHPLLINNKTHSFCIVFECR
jgi:hypothetical protein